MTTDVTPIPWRDVAIVAFRGDRPVILTSAEPGVLYSTVTDLIDEESAEEKHERLCFEESPTDRQADVAKAISELRWELYPTEQAKELFCKKYSEDKGNNNDD